MQESTRRSLDAHATFYAAQREIRPLRTLAEAADHGADELADLARACVRANTFLAELSGTGCPAAEGDVNEASTLVAAVGAAATIAASTTREDGRHSCFAEDEVVERKELIGAAIGVTYHLWSLWKDSDTMLSRWESEDGAAKRPLERAACDLVQVEAGALSEHVGSNRPGPGHAEVHHG